MSEPTTLALTAADPASTRLPADADQTVDLPAGPNHTADRPADPNRTTDLSADAPTVMASGLPAVPGYELAEEVGRGAMGVVYRARDTALGRDVAVKVLQDRFPAAGSAARRFLEEARITGQLQHPGIPPVHEVGTLADGRLFLAMKLIKGRTLADVLKAQQPGLPPLLPAFEAVCQAVGYAHAHGVVHRDLKPANVMVGAFGEVQVMDWGLAKVLRARRGTEPTESSEATAPATEIVSLRGDAAGTQPGDALGTPAYMAPEQAIGAVDQLDRRTDVFGLGAVLCHLLTGRPPYRGGDAESTRQLAALAKLTDAFARLDGCGAEPGLVALCKKCLSGEPADRPADAGELAIAVADLRAAADDRARRAEVARAEDAVRAAEERKRAAVELAEQQKRRKLQGLLAVAGLLLAAAGGGFAWWSQKQADERERDRLTADAAQARLDSERRVEQAKAEAAADRAAVGVETAVALAADLRRRYRYTEAKRVLDQAAGLLPADGPADLRARLDATRADLAFVVELDAIRGRATTWIGEPGGKGRFDTAGAPPAYRRAFAARGLDVTTDDPAAVAARVRASAVAGELVAALDIWSVYESDVPLRDRVLTVARAADPGAWLDRFRDPVRQLHPVDVAVLARDADPTALRPATAVALALLQWRWELDPMPFLLAAQSAHPGDFDLAFYLGLFARDPADQVAYYRTARAIRADSYPLHINMGMALSGMKQWDAAIAADRAALALDPTNAQAHYNLGVTLNRKGEWDAAAAANRAALALDPRYAKAHVNLGVALGGKGEWDAAITAFRAALALDPNLAEAHYSMGLALTGKGQADAAIAAYRAAVAADPNLAEAHTNLGVALGGKREWDAAIAAFRIALALDPNLAEAHYSMGLALTGKGQADAAIAAYRAAVAADPNLAEAHCNLGRALQRQDRCDEALVMLRKGHELGSRQSGWHHPSARWVAECERVIARKLAPPPRAVTR